MYTDIGIETLELFVSSSVVPVGVPMYRYMCAVNKEDCVHGKRGLCTPQKRPIYMIVLSTRQKRPRYVHTDGVWMQRKTLTW